MGKGIGLWNIIMAPYFDEGGGAGAGAGAGAGGGEPEKVSMTKAELEALIEGRIGAAVKAATKNAGGGASAEEKAELERLRKAEEDRQREALAAKGKYDEALKSQEESIRKEYEPKITTEKERADKAHKQLEERVIGLAVVEAAGKLNAVNPAQVRRLIDNQLRMDDEYNATVVDEKGNQRFVAGKAMTPEQLVKEFLDQNPHLVRSTAGAGGGASGGKSTTGGGDASEAAKKEAEIKALEEQYRKTRDTNLLTRIRLESENLRKLKAAAA
jgi:hypothetical protein